MLYLQDSSEETSFMVLAGQGMWVGARVVVQYAGGSILIDAPSPPHSGLLIEAWKITKVVDIRVRPAEAGSVIPYSITFEGELRRTLSQAARTS